MVYYNRGGKKMSKITVFKFKINDSSLANRIITNYVESNHYEYNLHEN